MVEENERQTTGQRPAEGMEPMDLISRAKVYLPYKWAILGVALVCALIAAIVVFMVEPVYRATATIMIESKQSRILDVENIYDPGNESVAYYATQFQILASRDLAEKAVARIDWDKYPEFVPEPEEEGGWLSFLPFVGESEASQVKSDATKLSDDRRRRLVDAFQKHTEIQQVAGTLLVRVHFLSHNPELAKKAANLLTDVYIESGFEAKLQTAQRATDWMSNRLDTIRENLGEAQSELQQYREQENIINIGGGRGVIESELADNMERLREARRTMTEYENTYRQIQQANGELEKLKQIPALHEAEVVQHIEGKYAEAQQELKELRSRYGPKHPKMIAAKARFEEARSTYLAQLRDAAAGIRTDYEIARENVESLSKLVQQNRQELEEVDRKEYRLNILEREADTNRELYDAILTRFKQADIEGDFQSLRAQVVDPAILPEEPYKPQKMRIIAYAGMGGLFLGLFLVFVREQLDDTIRSAQDFEQLTGVSILANLPLADTGDNDRAMSRLVLDDPHSLFTEGIRTVRTGLVLSDLDKSKKRLLVTSSVPREGKSCIASNLALSFGQMERVLLVEGDLRRPTLGRYLGLAGKTIGLTELLTGEAERSQALHALTDSVDFLPVGNIPPNPAELLSTNRFAQMLDNLAADYDRVIFDSAPCQPVSDSMLLARHVDGVVFVVQYEKTGRHAINVALKRLAQTRVPIVGAVLNFFEEKSAYESSYYSYYGSGTG